MIGANGRVVLMDFGMHTFADQAIDREGVVPVPESWPYKPAEELWFFINDAGPVLRTQQMDVYAFATTIYTVRSFSNEPSWIN
jgi:hypothetical protein